MNAHLWARAVRERARPARWIPGDVPGERVRERAREVRLSLEDVSDGVLEAAWRRRRPGRRGAEAVSAPRLVILLGALCQGSFETKIEVCFRSMDAKGVKGITSDQATELRRRASRFERS